VPRYPEATLAAIKNAVDIVALVGEYLPLIRSGTKFKALCPFHDDHNPSLELNPERQSFKCWSCGAGGDVFDFVKDFERVEFPEALRMLAERAGIALENPSAGPMTAPMGLSKSELLAVNAWAERAFAEALALAPEVLAYTEARRITRASVERFRLGYAPDVRDWLTTRAWSEGYTSALLEQVGLISRSPESPGLTRERFRGRLIFPIHDLRARTLGFGGRILPGVERSLAAAGKNGAKYLNTPETALFHKRRLLYGADLARAAARAAGWVAVVEGYTDVIAAHQVGLENVVGTLGTALGDDHVLALRRLADRIVLIFDGDEAGQAAADRSLELFLGHEVDVRVLTLPENLDPCDFLLQEGADAFRARVGRAVDPLDFALRRAETRFDLDSLDEARQAAEWFLKILVKVPVQSRAGLGVKVNRAINILSEKLRIPVAALLRQFKELEVVARRSAARSPVAVAENQSTPTRCGSPSISTTELDKTDLGLIKILLNEPTLVSSVISRVPVGLLRDAPLRAILQASYDIHGEGDSPTFERVTLRLEDPAVKSLAAGLVLPIEPAPLVQNPRSIPPPWEDCLTGVMVKLAERDRQIRLRDLKAALAETDQHTNPDAYRALQLEYRRLMNQRPAIKTKHAS
jgi:DNA primase